MKKEIGRREFSASGLAGRLSAMASPSNVAGMARYGINPADALGISIYTLRDIAREVIPSHPLALDLWATGIHEARLLASMVDEPTKAADEQLEQWAADFDSWDVCDQVCDNLFQHTRFAYRKAVAWSRRSEEFVKRAGFTLMACLAFHDKGATDEKLARFFRHIVRESVDGRNYVKKAVNWALRNLGKRNTALNAMAIATAMQIAAIGSPSARWIASDALRELQSEKTRARLARKRQG